VPTNLVIHGAGGRMGKEVALIAFADPQVKVIGCVDAVGHPCLGRDMGALCGTGECGITVTSDIDALPLEECTVIDFSSPAAASSLASGLASRRSRLVVGTTGLGESDKLVLLQASKRIPVVHSPNMSLGVNLLFHLTEVAAARLAGSFDIEIIEAHHRNKKDSPSGTARRLGEIAASSLNKRYDDVVRNGRCGMVGERPRAEVGMHAVRGGDIVGDHTVLFAGSGERLELRHSAQSRATFAQGAVAAAKWLGAKGPGLYSMRDVLGI
jgi:4-hydroxy-tetrahydrodipicolinate reductase